MKKTVLIIVCLFLSACLTALPAAAVTLIEENFDSAYPGDDPLTLDELYGYFEWLNATPDSACDVMKIESGNVMRLTGYSDLRTMDYIPAEYVFSLAIKMSAPSSMVNIFVRGEMPGALQKTNPRNFDIMQVFNYYEWDWYAENGGKGGSGTGGSGISLSFREDGITLCVKKYAEDSLTVASDTCTVPYPENVTVGEFINVKVTDDAKRINFYVNDGLIAYAELSENSISYESDGTNVSYYKYAKIYDKDNELLLNVENTRLHYNGSQLAISTRYDSAYVDDLKIYFGDGAIEAEKNGYTPETAPADTEGETAQTETGTVTDTEEIADVSAEETNADTVTEAEQTGNKTGGISKKAVIIIIAAVVDAVIIAVLAFVILKKKK